MQDFLKLKAEISAALADQGSPEWQMMRLGKFTSSEIHKLMTEPRNKTEYLSETAKGYIMQKAAEIITGIPGDEAFSKAIEWGKENEGFARQLLEVSLGVKYEVPGFTIYNEHYGGSVDGLCELHVCEIKCPYNSSNHLQNLLIEDSDDLLKIHKEYWWQLQSNMLISGMDSGIFVSFDPRYNDDLRLKIVDVPADHRAQESIKIKVDISTSELKRIVSVITKQK